MDFAAAAVTCGQHHTVCAAETGENVERVVVDASHNVLDLWLTEISAMGSIVWLYEAPKISPRHCMVLMEACI